MKKVLAIVLSAMMITPSVSAASNSMQVTEDNDYLSQLSELIQK